jgi:Do/DeqQ family serine protease
MKKRLIPLILLMTFLPLFSQEEESWKETVNSLQRAFRDVSSQVLPVVVEINVIDVVKRDLPAFNPWQFFFGNPRDDKEIPPQQQEYRQSGLGSGVIVDQRDDLVYVITNNHVAGSADEIKITLYDGREFDGTLVGTDQNRDLALLSFKSTGKIPIAKLGDSQKLQVGDWVLAVGNPYGFESTVTQGIISATGRKNEAPGGGFTDYLQTDASINSGNSGGALVNLEGEVVGINTWIASQSGGSIGLGFAIPINNVKKAIDDLITTGNVKYGWLGVHMSTATDIIKEKMALTEWEGVFIFNVYSNSPAMVAGIRPGDLIIAIDGSVVESSNDLIGLISGRRPGERVKVTYIRNEREYTKLVELALRDELALGNNSMTLWPGFTVAELTPEMREQLGLSRTDGNLIIGSVNETSKAASLGLQDGDVIKSINKKSPRSLKDFYETLIEESELSIKVLRRGYEFEYQLSLIQ